VIESGIEKQRGANSVSPDGLPPVAEHSTVARKCEPIGKRRGREAFN
jgi:hypothetical protein